MAWIKALANKLPSNYLMTGMVPYLAENIDTDGYVSFNGNTYNFTNKAITVENLISMTYNTSWIWSVTSAYNGTITNTDTGVTVALTAGVPANITLRNGTSDCHFSIALLP